MQKLDLAPNTPEWLEARKKYRTASEAPIVCGISPFTTPEKFKLIKAGLAKQYYSKAMQQGHELEDMSRQWANAQFGRDFKEEIWVNYGYLASLDGIDGDTIVEIKTSSRTYADVVAGNVPDYYELQIQQQLYCSPATKAYLIAYCPKTNRFAASEPITPRIEAMQQIENGWAAFDAMPIPDGDIDAGDNLDLLRAFEKYATLKSEVEQITAEMETIKEKIMAYAAERTVNCRGYSIVYKKPATKVDYRKACKDAKIDLANYTTTAEEPSYMLRMAPPPFQADEDE